MSGQQFLYVPEPPPPVYPAYPVPVGGRSRVPPPPLAPAAAHVVPPLDEVASARASTLLGSGGGVGGRWFPMTTGMVIAPTVHVPAPPPGESPSHLLALVGAILQLSVTSLLCADLRDPGAPPNGIPLGPKWGPLGLAATPLVIIILFVTPPFIIPLYRPMGYHDVSMHMFFHITHVMANVYVHRKVAYIYIVCHICICTCTCDATFNVTCMLFLERQPPALLKYFDHHLLMSLGPRPHALLI